MLVYIREDCQSKLEVFAKDFSTNLNLTEDVLCDVNQEDIPENLITRFDYDK